MSRLDSEIKLLRAGKTYIYILIDPRNNDIRYVGKSDNPLVRLNEHIRKSENKITYKNNWIRSLIKNGVKPKLNIIDEVPLEEWGFWEQYWIEQFKMWGFKLTNIANGGVGGNLGDIVNKKISKALKGRKISKESKDKMSISSIGKKHSEGTKNKMSKQKVGVNNPMYGKERPESSKKYRKVVQLSLNGNKIKLWDGLSIASRELNINRCTISDVCNGRKKTAGGFKWKYYE